MVVTDASGTTSTRQLVIEAIDGTALDQKLRAIWKGMNDALTEGDKGRAMGFLNTGAKAKYGPVFDVLMPEYAQIASTFSPLVKADLSAHIGEYVVRRLDGALKRIYFIYLLRDPDGVWRIAEM